MGSAVERAVAALFPQDGGNVRNVKYLRGRNPAVTAEQILLADEQVRTGVATLVDDIDGDLVD
jgi:hypothetical protein